ncbi:hypothetical protein [uncultured Helicobacter sp.]|uniref:hypothetical protein n=1 Tax=uncultured Helicobacter sp. TaxID=175537 RepID=UPI00374E28F1
MTHKENIQTHNADYKLTQKFLDYANCAYASYASLKYALYLIFGIFVIALLNGCSFKYIDPQYYKFKRLCKEVEKDNTIYDDNLYNLFLKAKQKISFYNGRKFYDETTKQEFLVDNFDIKFDSQEISNRLSKTIYKLLYNEKEFYRYSAYNYHYSGLFLKGDEGAGWHIDFDNEILQCKPKISY